MRNTIILFSFFVFMNCGEVKYDEGSIEEFCSGPYSYSCKELNPKLPNIQLTGCIDDSGVINRILDNTTYVTYRHLRIEGAVSNNKKYGYPCLRLVP